MLKKTVKLLALDLDGTLVREDQSISAEDIEAVARAQKAGVQVVIATGRVFTTAKDALLRLGICTPVICSNGADIRIKGKTIYSKTIENEWLRKAYSLFQPLCSQCFVYVGDHIYCKTGQRHEELFRKWQVEQNKDLMVFCSDVEHLLCSVGDNALKFLVCIEDESRKSEMEKLARSFGYFDAVWGERLQMELTPKGVNKASALYFVAKMLNVGMEEVMAVGDSTNDLEMICRVGTGIAMGNSMPEVFAVADGVTLPVWENGIAHAIGQYIFEQEICEVASAG